MNDKLNITDKLAMIDQSNNNQGGDRSELLSTELLAKLRKASCDAYDDYRETGSEHSLGAHRAFAITIQWLDGRHACAAKMRAMETAPRNGDEILVRFRCPWRDNGEYHVCRWVDKYSTLIEGGAWRYETEYEVSHAVEKWCEGWMPIPSLG